MTWLAVDEGVSNRQFVRWFKENIRGDHDAEEALAQGGFDTYGNGRGHGDAWAINASGTPSSSPLVTHSSSGVP